MPSEQGDQLWENFIQGKKKRKFIKINLNSKLYRFFQNF